VILFDSSVLIDALDADSPFHKGQTPIAEAVQENGQGEALLFPYPQRHDDLLSQADRYF